MGPGTVISIHIAPKAEGPMASVPEVHAVPGRGLEGDRYFQRVGTYSERPGTGRQITLIELEAIEALARDEGLRIRPGDARRNVVTGGVPLNHLVGRAFAVGAVTLRGTRLCEPCAHLARLVGEPKVLPALVHRGGLRADIVTEGVIRVGDPIEPRD
jgi:MOSC domain-containing protein YiiM